MRIGKLLALLLVGAATAQAQTPALVDADACPVHDPVPRKRGRCPETPLSTEAAATRAGGKPDRDHDGIPDAIDMCPDKPETWNGFSDEDGCPDIADCVLSEGPLRIDDWILFARNSDTIARTTWAILNVVAQALVATRATVEVAGHVDRTERRGLSERRARRVVEYLLAHGVDRARITSKDYGATCPHVRGDKEPWLNRRVDFRRVRAETH